jgi:hypothetical protein
MTKFLLFAAPAYYPYGGLGDCKGYFDTREALDAAVTRLETRDRYACHALQVPEMLVHNYDRHGRYEGFEPLEEMLGKGLTDV